jgi:hypothetical protein
VVADLGAVIGWGRARYINPSLCLEERPKKLADEKIKLIILFKKLDRKKEQILHGGSKRENSFIPP